MEVMAPTPQTRVATLGVSSRPPTPCTWATTPGASLRQQEGPPAITIKVPPGVASDDDSIQPPRFTIDLSTDPDLRYSHVVAALSRAGHDLPALFASLTQFLDWLIPVPFLAGLAHKLARRTLRGLHDKEEDAELKGIAAATGVPMWLLVAYNVFLDLMLGCTSGGVRVMEGSEDDSFHTAPSTAPSSGEPSLASTATTTTPSSRMLHFRTLDWSMDQLRDIVVELNYVRRPGGPVVATTVGYFGYVGVLTGVRRGLSMSLNFRPSHDKSSLRKKIGFRWHQTMVVLGYRRGVASILRGLLLTEDAELDAGKCGSGLLQQVLLAEQAEMEQPGPGPLVQNPFQGMSAAHQNNTPAAERTTQTDGVLDKNDHVHDTRAFRRWRLPAFRKPKQDGYSNIDKKAPLAITAPVLQYIKHSLPKARCSACYLVFCTPEDVQALEKDNGSGKFYGSLDFNATFNHDVADEENMPKEAAPRTSGSSAAGENVVHTNEHDYIPAKPVGNIIECSLCRKHVLDNLWAEGNTRMQEKMAASTTASSGSAGSNNNDDGNNQDSGGRDNDDAGSSSSSDTASPPTNTAAVTANVTPDTSTSSTSPPASEQQKNNKAGSSSTAASACNGAVHPDEVLKMLLNRDISNHMTHYAVVMDPASGQVLWRRVFPAPASHDPADIVSSGVATTAGLSSRRHVGAEAMVPHADGRGGGHIEPAVGV